MLLALDEQARRIQAAQALGGFSRVELLAAALADQQSRVKLKRLRALWRGADAAIGSELTEIARACDLPGAFFTVDFARLPELDEQAAVTPAAPPASLDDIVDAVLRRLEERERLEPPGRLGRLHEDDQPTGADRPAAEHPRAEDSR